jgi:hypothetical protein
VETRVLRERPRTQRGEHVRRRPRAAEQPEHGAPSPLALGGRARSGDAIGDDVDRPARRRGEHQRGDQHDRRRAHECGHERDCAEPRDDRVDRRRVAARSERDERTAHRDVADRAGREGKADRTRRHTVAMQPARGQQLSDAPERPGHDQRSGPREHAPVAQRADRAGPPAGRLRRRPTRLWRLPARPRRWRLGRRAGGQRERAAHDQAGGRDQGERKRAGRAGDEHPPSAGPTIVPTEEKMIAGPTRRPPPIWASHAAPAVQSIPNDRPYTERPTRSAVSEPRVPTAQARTSMAPEAIVTRRAPSRSERMPAGIETASITSAGSARTSAEPEAERGRHAWQQRNDHGLAESGDEEQGVDEQRSGRGVAREPETEANWAGRGGLHRPKKIRSDRHVVHDVLSRL